MKTSIVILTFNKLDYTQQCIESIRKYTEPGFYELIVVDNYSTDGTVEWLKKQDDIITLYNEQNAGFPRGCNQGIEIATGENILLLNNDTVVTVNWLDNLLKCLYSSTDIGLVGPVTNNCSYYQAIRTDYKDLREMDEFASKYNQSNPLLWEERLKLIGFCMLIKREVIKQIGFLDEKFSPGDFEDDDYSYRARKAGFRLMLCKDTFIHRFGSISFKTDNNEYAELMANNRMKFKQKWGFDASYSGTIRNDIIELMDSPKDSFINVLEIGCACGGTLLKIKHQYRNVELYGIELNENAAEIASHFATVISENIETSELRYPEGFFDYIILADVLEHLNDPWTILQKLNKYLKSDGKILASIPNVMHYTILKDLINGKWNYEDSGILDKTHLRFFTRSTANQMFLDTGYTNIKLNILPLVANEEDHKFVQELCQLSNSDQITQFFAYQYLIKAYKGSYREPVSIVIVTYNSMKTLDGCLNACVKYLGKEDEIIIVDNNSVDGTHNYLNEQERSRIKTVFNQENLGFSKATNVGIINAVNDYIIFLNPDVTVTEGWIDRLVQHFKDSSIGAVGPLSDYVAGLQKVQLYIDKNLTFEGYDFLSNRLNLEYGGKNIQSKLLIGFCLVTQKSILEKIGYLDEELFLGNDDLELSWRLRKNGYKLLVAIDTFVHHEGQVSFKTVEKSKTDELVQDSTNKLAEKLIAYYGFGNVPSPIEIWNINWFIPDERYNGMFRGYSNYKRESGEVVALPFNEQNYDDIKTSIIILTLNNLQYTKLCIDSIISNTKGRYEIVIVDNGSTDGTKEYFEGIQQDYPNLRLIFNDKNEGYAYACNQGAALATGEYLVFLNNDVIVPPNWLYALLSTFAPDPRIGIVGPRTNNCAGLQKVEGIEYKLENYLAYAENWQRQNRAKITETSMVIGFCMAVRKDVLDIVGGFDTEYGTGNFEDNDFCLRARMIGFKIAIRHDVLIHHFGSKTFINEKVDYESLMKKNKLIFDTKWQRFGDEISDDEKLASIYVPLDYNVMFNREVPPIAINELKRISILAIPDWHDQATWYSLIFKFLQLIQIKPEICLVLRVDPPAEEEFQSVMEHLETFMQDMGIEDIPNLILEGTPLIPIRRAGLYTACPYFVDLPQQRGFLYRRAAEACGCEIITVDELAEGELD
ncbi:MAG: glycosyltransferase [Desulfitobacteriaceae bacterium]